MFVYFVDCFCPLRSAVFALPLSLSASLVSHVSFRRWWWQWRRWSMWKLNFTSKINYAGVRAICIGWNVLSYGGDLCLFMCQQQTTSSRERRTMACICELWKWILDEFSVFSILLPINAGNRRLNFQAHVIVYFGHFSFSFFEMEYAPRLVIIARHGIRRALGLKCKRSQKDLAITDARPQHRRSTSTKNTLARHDEKDDNNNNNRWQRIKGTESRFD